MSTPSETAPADQDALPTEHRTAAVVYNPVKVHLPTLKATVEQHQQEAGWAETLWFETTEEDPGGGMARAALEAGAHVVAAAGGDGTVRAVAEVVHGSGASLALLPSGTGNLLARNMKLPLDDLASSAHTIFSGHERAIDFGLIGIERPDGAREQFGFVVMAGLGLDARMIANTRPELKKRVGWLAYLDSLLRSVRDADGFEFKYRLDESARNGSVRAHSVIVGNCGMLQANAMLLPDAEIDDGVFDIVVMRPRGFFGWVRIGARVFWENGILRWFRRSALSETLIGRRITTAAKQERPLRYMRGEEFTLRLEKPDEFEIDGDPVGEITAFRARIDPGSLTVKVPTLEPRPSWVRGRKR